MIAVYWADHQWTSNPLDRQSEWAPNKQRRMDIATIDKLMQGEGTSGSATTVNNVSQHVKSYMMLTHSKSQESEGVGQDNFHSTRNIPKPSP